MIPLPDDVPSESSSLRVLDLFSGAGGLSSGFKRAGFQIVGGSDNDPDAMATFAHNFPEASTVVGDIRRPDIKRRIVEIGQDIDVVVGGPPCQGFSQVRNHSRLIDDPRNSLYREFVRVLGRVKPRAFVMENVQGMAQMGVKEQVLADLSQRGRYVVSAQLLDAADFGVPQARKRLVFIGVHRDLATEPPRVEGTGASVALGLMADSAGRRGYKLALRSDVVARELMDRLEDPLDIGVVSAEQAIGDLSFLRAGDRQDSLTVRELLPTTSAYQTSMRTSGLVANLAVPRMNEDTTLRLDGIPAGGNYLDLSEALRARYITGQKWGPSTDSSLLSRKHYYAYRRLHPSLWAWTLNTKADAVYHYSVARALSVREFCRLQSFADDFTVVTDSRIGAIAGRVPNGSAHSRYRQIGNAVPPLLGMAVAERLKESLPARSMASA